MEIRRGGKEKAFQNGTYSLKTINIQHILFYIHKIIFYGKKEIRFSKQNTY